MPSESVLFDTNIIIDIIAGLPAARNEYDGCADRAISIVTWIEVMVGVQPKDEAKVLSFLGTFIQIPLSAAIAQKAVDVRRTNRLKLPDAILLATALVEGRILLTRNIRDFSEADFVHIPYRV